MSNALWILGLTSDTERAATGHDISWTCRVPGCGCCGTAHTDHTAVILAVRHQATHCASDLASASFLLRH